MSWIDALILGIVQGLTEFLPVSSSGHLELAKLILGDESIPKDSLLMTVVLHAATAIATIIVFRKDILEIIKGIFKWEWNEEMKFAFKIGVSMIPAGLVGILLEEKIEGFFSGNIMFVGFMLIVTSLLLFLADLAKTTSKNVKFSDAFIIGISQAIAILPGISRSGATISTSVILKIDREKAARFSFLMVVPLIIGKMILDIASGDIANSSISAITLSIGFLASLITGILACVWMIKIVKNAKLKYFAIYCLIVGTLTIILSI
jgi:undecaprenyl-diphosphatase